MIPGGHDHDSAESAESIGESGEKAAVYKGLVVLSGIYFFLVAERMMTILGDWKRQKKAKVRIVRRYCVTGRGGGS